MRSLRIGTAVLSLTLLGAGSPHEVTVHHRLSDVAAQRSLRMQHFIDDLEIDDLSSPHFGRLVGHGRVLTLQQLIRAEMGGHVEEGSYGNEIGFPWTPEGLIRAGSITEDSWSGSWMPPFVRLRFCNHFYRPTSRTTGHRLTSKLCLPEFRTDAVSWVFGNGNDRNLHGWDDALEQMHLGLTAADRDQRTAHLAKAFYDLGHVIHLVQDFTQPSHVRDDAHPPGNAAYIESYFHDRRPLVESIAARAALPAGDGRSAQRIFRELTHFTSVNFFSDDTIDWQTGAPRLAEYPPPVIWPTASDLYIVNDSSAARGLSMARTRFPILPEPNEFYFVPPPTPDIDFQPVPLFTIRDDRVMQSNGERLFPPAVTQSAAVLDAFFRARLAAKVTEVERGQSNLDIVTFEIENITEVAPGIELAPFTLMDLSELTLYQDLDHQRQPLELVKPIRQSFLAPGDSVTVKAFYRREGAATAGYPATVVYRGDIGDHEGVAAAIARRAVSLWQASVSASALGQDLFSGIFLPYDFTPPDGVTLLPEGHFTDGDAPRLAETECARLWETDPIEIVRDRGSWTLEGLDTGAETGRIVYRMDLDRTVEPIRPPTPEEQEALDQSERCLGEAGARVDAGLVFLPITIHEGQSLLIDLDLIVSEFPRGTVDEGERTSRLETDFAFVSSVAGIGLIECFENNEDGRGPQDTDCEGFAGPGAVTRRYSICASDIKRRFQELYPFLPPEAWEDFSTSNFVILTSKLDLYIDGIEAKSARVILEWNLQVVEEGERTCSPLD